MAKRNRTTNTATDPAAPVSAPAADTIVTETAVTVKAKPARYVKGRLPMNWVITLTQKGTPNPKRPSGDSYGRFALHKTGQTVAEYVQACVDTGNKAAKAHDDVRWDLAHGFITVEAPAAAAEQAA